MAHTGDDKEKSAHPSPGGSGAPGEPSELSARSWRAVLTRTGKEFMDDELPDRAAALTYYSVLSIFPALLVLVSLLGVIGTSATRTVLDNLRKLAPGPARDILGNAVEQLQGNAGASGVVAIISLLAAVWSASGYVGGFIRTANAVYDLPEGRPVWKLTPLRVGLTLVLMVLLAMSAVIVVFTGPLARRAGQAIGAGEAAVTVWNIAKWPVLLVLVVLMIGLLFWRAPNVHGLGFRWLSPGSVVAVLLWLVASGAFALYVANFGSYNKTYGTLAGVITFLIWLWLSNLAILLGLELDAELARQRAISGGMPASQEPYVEPRDTRTWPPEERAGLAEGARPGVPEKPGVPEGSGGAPA
ncbi:YihY/virulence factor BrkB family protein [Streptomyces sp. LP05-1]|uniref:YihY/virulence factor BrkB family protein n=1 Tax=Streptomyces pyxinae TaxID=2970734 RepID=A0ABT2CH75_9ACTN|nr:YihY/virulence factor BrkB family protein [Streptomyces sp. LP05-1]MCS0636772.1 YihY/virulence factor BrkB family protein [Streptomyces sp. LP05-1]